MMPKNIPKLQATPDGQKQTQVYRTQSYWDLFDAIGEGRADLVIEILQTTADPVALLRKKDLQGLTPLKKSIALSKSEIARILVAFGAEPSVRDPLGKTPLHIAVMQGRRDLIAPLLVSADSSVNVQDNAGNTPLHYAVRGKHMKAINWLLYAGADITLRNKEERSAVEMCEEDSPIVPMIREQGINLDDCPVELSSAFIGKKQLNMIGPDGSLMFVTSGDWSRDMQFILNVRIRPFYATPRIPLRHDEMFFCDLCHYRMMRRLHEGQRRVMAYFLLFEPFHDSKVVMKVTSKKKFLGEVPVTLSTYAQQSFTCYLAAAELDLKDEGQFVLVKTVMPLLLTKGEDGVYSHRSHPKFKINIPDGCLPKTPPDWNATRQERAWEERQEMMKKLNMDSPEESAEGIEADANASANKNTNNDRNQNSDQTEQESVRGNEEGGEGPEGEGEEGEGEQAEEEVEEEDPDVARERRLGPMLEGDEPDESEDFYYISQGWGTFLEYRPALNQNQILDKNSLERTTIRCTTGFYRVWHTSKANPTKDCMIQIPKTSAFFKMGTVLVFYRTPPAAEEDEFPDPDDTADEQFLSEDGKNTWGVYWLLKERERWNLLPTGIVNKKTRVVFQTSNFTTYIVVQLTHGTEKVQKEDPTESSSSDEGSEIESHVSGVGEGESEREESRAEDEESEKPASKGEGEGEAEEGAKRKKKKKRRRVSIHKEESSDSDSPDEKSEAPTENVRASTVVEEGGRKVSYVPSTVPTLNGDTKSEPDGSSPSKQVSGAEVKSVEESEAEKKDENASNIRRPRDDDADSDMEKNTSNNNVNNDNNNSNNNNKDDDNPDPDGNATGSGRGGNRSDNAVQGEDRGNNSIQKGNKNSNSFPGENRTNNQTQEWDDDEENLPSEMRTISKGLEPIASNFAVVVGTSVKKPKPLPLEADPVEEEEPVEGEEQSVMETEAEMEEEEGAEAEEKESIEDLPPVMTHRFSIGVIVNGKTVLEDFTPGPPLTESRVPDSEMATIAQTVALTWRFRNHIETTIPVFTRARDGGFDLVIELVKLEDLYVRAEHWWSLGYKMVAQSSTIPFKSGRLLSFAMEGTMVVESPPGSVPGYIMTRTMYCYLSKINCLEYFVKKASAGKDEEEARGPKKGPRKKEEAKHENEPDAQMEIMGYPRGSRTNGVDIAVMTIALNGPDLWHDRHVALRESDNVLLERLVKCLKKEKPLVKKWWKAILMFGYSEKEVELEKGRTKWSKIIEMLVKRWFEDNLNAIDRGILKLLAVLHTMKLETGIERVITVIKNYKSELLLEKNRPRYLKLLFHWVIQTKITKNNLLRMIGPQILKPVSDIFLMRLSELLDRDQLYKIGSYMDVEDNVIHAIGGEEVILDPEYLPFRVLIKSRQKKDEIIHYTLLLMEMVKQCEQEEAKAFVITETKKWMETVADTEPELCAKLENVFG